MTEERLKKIESASWSKSNATGAIVLELLAEVRRLQEAARNRLEGGWQDISTAPKDGTRVLALFGEECTEAYYWAELQRWEPVSLPSHGCGCCASSNDRPTHWMPIPVLPEAK